MIHNAISRGFNNDALKAAVGASKDAGGVERFSETLQGVINIWGLPEWAWLRKEYLWCKTLAAGPVAAEFSAVGVSCAVGSRALVMVDGASVSQLPAASNGRAQMVARTTLSGTLTQNAVNSTRDQRLAPDPNAFQANVPFVEMWNGTDAADIGNTNPQEAFTTPASATQPLLGIVPCILKPGGGLVVTASVVNTITVVTFWGRSRAALPGELV